MVDFLSRSKEGKYNRVHCFADFHMHTTYSLHAMASPYEMIKKANELGLSMIAITDHAYNFNPFSEHAQSENQKIRARNITEYMDPYWENSKCTRVIGGIELNMFCNNFVIEDYIEPVGFSQGLKLIGLHDWFIPNSEVKIEEVIEEFEKQAQFGKIHIFAHPVRDINKLCKWSVQSFDEVLHKFCEIAEKYDIAMEINTSNKDSGDLLTLINVLKDHKCLITLGSDAHCPDHIGRGFYSAMSILDENGLLVSGRVVNIDESMCRDMAHKAFPKMEFDKDYMNIWTLCD